MRKKLRDSSGLTMVETLCAAAILVLLCLMMNTGIHMAVTNYRTLTGEAEARLLLSSLSDALADKLRYCVVTEETVPGTGTKTYANSVGAVGVSDGTTPGVPADMVLVGGDKLLPEGAYGEPKADGTRRYQVTDASVTEPPYAVGAKPVFTVRLEVKDTQTNLSKEANLTVRCLNPVKKEGPP